MLPLSPRSAGQSVDLLCNSIRETSGIKKRLKAETHEYYSEAKRTGNYGSMEHLKSGVRALRESYEKMRLIGKLVLPRLNQDDLYRVQTVRDNQDIHEDWLPIPLDPIGLRFRVTVKESIQPLVQSVARFSTGILNLAMMVSFDSETPPIAKPWEGKRKDDDNDDIYS